MQRFAPGVYGVPTLLVSADAPSAAPGGSLDAHPPRRPVGKGHVPYTPPPTRVLSADEQARVLDLLRRLETEAMFTADWDRVSELLWSWRWSVRMGRLECADVPKVSAELRRWGIQ